MSFYTVTALTAFVGAIVAMVVGFVWYGPLFGKKWAHIIGMTMPEGKEAVRAAHKSMMPRYALNFVTAFITYYALGFFAAFVGRLSIIGALVYAIFLWAGFLMPLEASAALWSGKSTKLSWQMFFITAGYQLVAIVLAGIAWAWMYPHFI